MTPTGRSAGPTSGGSPSARSWAVWVEAARPRTLTAAVAPVLVGTAAAVAEGGVVVGWRFLAALVVGLGLQVGVNYANDWFDGVRGGGVGAAAQPVISRGTLPDPTLMGPAVPDSGGGGASRDGVPASGAKAARGPQVGVNDANAWCDGVRGVDTAARVGPRRAVAAGLVTPAAMRAATGAALAVAAAAGLALAAAAGWELVLVGAAAIAAAVGYSGGPRPYASAGLGEVFVFVFFGLVATVGAAYVHLERVSGLAVLAAVPVGLVAVAILVANNLRDVHTDAAAGKRTLAVRVGEPGTRRLYAGLVVGAVAGVVALAVAAGSGWPLLGLAAAPVAWPGIRAVRAGAADRDLIAVLVATARAQLVLGVALAAGLAVA